MYSKSDGASKNKQRFCLKTGKNYMYRNIPIFTGLSLHKLKPHLNQWLLFQKKYWFPF